MSHYSDDFNNLCQFLNNLLNSTETTQTHNEIKAEALKCISLILGSVEIDNAMKFQSFFKNVMNKFDSLMSQVDEDGIFESILDLIQNLTANRNPLIKGSINEIITYFNSEKVLMNEDYDDNKRRQILALFSFVAESKITAIHANLDSIIQNLIKLALSKLEESKEQALKDEEPFNHVIFDVFKNISKNAQKKKLGPLLNKYLNQMLQQGKEEYLEIMYFIYGAVVEGLADFYKPHIKDLLERVIKPGVNHASSNVRKVAMRTVLMISEYLMPEIATFHADIMPMLIENLTSDDLKQVADSLCCIDVYLGGLE